MIEIGEPAPTFTLRNQDRAEVTLEDHRGRPLLLVFMPLAFTRVCGGEMCTIRDNLALLDDADTATVAITCDNVPVNRAWSEAEGFGFPILSDFWPHGEVTRSYGCFNDKLGVPHRATFVIDADGFVRDVITTDTLGEARPFPAYLDSLASL